jgi:signal peptidase II
LILRRIRAEDAILPVVALLIFAADQVTKNLVVSNMQLGQTIELASWLTPIFKLTYITNTGVAFGLLSGLGDVFKVVDVIVIVGLLIYQYFLPPNQKLIRIALGLQLGGASGNLLDRLTRGSVVDFLDLNFWPMKNWPIGNIADITIVVGVILLGITMLQEINDEETAMESEVQHETEEAVPEKGTL